MSTFYGDPEVLKFLSGNWNVDTSAPAPTTGTTSGASAPIPSPTTTTRLWYCMSCDTMYEAGKSSGCPHILGSVSESSPPVEPLSDSDRAKRLAAIAYDSHHVPRTYPHKWAFDERGVEWRCNCAIEPLRVSDALLMGFKG